MNVLLQTAKQWHVGQGGLRAPLDRFVQPDGNWGYVVSGSRPPNGHSHTLVNFVGNPSFFDERENAPNLADIRVLMERNHEDNARDLAEAGQPVYRCWSELWGKYAGETLVIASCGPSLTQSLPYLYRHRMRFRLMCLNRSQRAFMDAEVKPDFYYFVERRALPEWAQEVEDRTGRPLSPLDLSGVTMIGTPPCDPRMVRSFDPDKRYWGWTSLGGMGNIPEIASLKSYDVKAATTIGNAPYIAWKLGFKKIVLVGCDFSLDCRIEIDDKTKRGEVVPRRMYFDRMWHHTHYSADTEFLKKLLPLQGHNAKACVANADLLGHRDYFDGVLDIIHHEAGVEVVNATPRGLLRFNPKRIEEALA